MRRTLLCALPALALTCLALFPADSFAQRRGGGGGSFNSGFNRGFSNALGGGYGYSGYGYGGYGGFNNSLGYSLGYGLGSNTFGYGGYGPGGIGYGRGYGGYGMGYGSGYYSSGWSPGYSSWGSGSYPGGYANSYPSDNYSIMPSESIAGATGTGYQSFYPPSNAGQFNDGTRAMIRVRVPADAQVMFEGTPTTQTGPERVFVTPPLEGNGNYTYKVTARWRDQSGQDVTRSETVRFSAGRTVDVDLMAAQNQGQSKTLRPNPAGSEEQSEPAPSDQPAPGRRSDQKLNPQSTVPANPGNAAPPAETRPERRPQPD